MAGMGRQLDGRWYPWSHIWSLIVIVEGDLGLVNQESVADPTAGAWSDGFEGTYKMGWVPLRLGEWVVAHDLAWVEDINGGASVELI